MADKNKDPQADGPWLLVPHDKTLPVRSVDPADKQSAYAGRIVQVLHDKNRRVGIREARSIVRKAARWGVLDKAERMEMLKNDPASYADLARAAMRVVEVSQYSPEPLSAPEYGPCRPAKVRKDPNG